MAATAVLDGVGQGILRWWKAALSADNVETPLSEDLLHWRQRGKRQKRQKVSEAMPSKFGTEIHRRLADHQPVEYIASQVGLRARVIRWHGASSCQCVVDGLEAQPVKFDGPALTGPVVLTLEQIEALPWHGQLRYAHIAGLGEQNLADETGLDVGLIEAVIGDDVRGEAARRYLWVTERVREMAPARWLKHQEDERQRELVEAARSSVDPELLQRFFTEIIRRQRGLLTAAEFPDFIQWLRELAVHRHAVMVPVIEAAIEAAIEAEESWSTNGHVDPLP